MKERIQQFRQYFQAKKPYFMKSEETLQRNKPSKDIHSRRLSVVDKTFDFNLITIMSTKPRNGKHASLPLIDSLVDNEIVIFKTLIFRQEI